MPNNILCFAFVVIHMDVGFSNPDALEADRQTRFNYFHAVPIGVASNVNAAPVWMCARSRPAVFLFPRRGTICGIEYKRNPGQFSGRIQFIHRVLFHIL